MVQVLPASCMHGVLPLVVKRTFEADEADQQPDEVAQDYHKVAKRKAQAFAFFEDERSAKMILGTALVAIAPADRLSLRLQHLDTRGSSVMELV